MKNPVEEAENRLWAYLEKMPPQDAAIMAAGFIAGTQGYTPMSAIIKLGITPETKGAFEDMAAAVYLITGGPFQWATYLLGESRQMKDESGADRPPTASETALAVLALGCIGTIEAYAVTRPGFLSGVGEVIKGIGEIVPL